MEFSEKFNQRMFRINGQKGLDWLADLPNLLDEFSQRWSLILLPPFEPISYNYVAPAITADGKPVVFKTGFPNPELLSEIYALRHFNGQGSVHLLKSNTDKQAMLLERIKPGEILYNLDDDQQKTRIAAQVMQQLWKPIAETEYFPTISQWTHSLHDIQSHNTPIANHLIDTAQQLSKTLGSSDSETVLLHGDLHHWNILSSQRHSWLALDPKGIVGGSIFDVGALLRNPVNNILSMPDFKDITIRRLDILTEILGFEGQHMLGWSLVQAVLAAQWSYEDGAEDWQTFEYCAGIFYELLLA